MVKGVLKVEPGYAGGAVPNPTYEMVCGGNTGHAEVVRVTFDTAIIKYDDLLNVFFAVHDPTTLNRQGNDSGTQYRSIILYQDDAQKQAAQNFIQSHAADFAPDKIVTTVEPLKDFFVAEDYHHHYFKNNPDKAYCQLVISPKLSKFKKLMSGLLKTE